MLRYLVILHGSISATPASLSELASSFVSELGCDPSEVAETFSNLPAILGNCESKTEAEEYLRLLQSMGGDVELIESTESDPPDCGMLLKKGDSNNADQLPFVDQSSIGRANSSNVENDEIDKLVGLLENELAEMSDSKPIDLGFDLFKQDEDSLNSTLQEPVQAGKQDKVDDLSSLQDFGSTPQEVPLKVDYNYGVEDLESELMKELQFDSSPIPEAIEEELDQPVLSFSDTADLEEELNQVLNEEPSGISNEKEELNDPNLALGLSFDAEECGAEDIPSPKQTDLSPASDSLKQADSEHKTDDDPLADFSGLAFGDFGAEDVVPKDAKQQAVADLESELDAILATDENTDPSEQDSAKSSDRLSLSFDAPSELEAEQSVIPESALLNDSNFEEPDLGLGLSFEPEPVVPKSQQIEPVVSQPTSDKKTLREEEANRQKEQAKELLFADESGVTPAKASSPPPVPAKNTQNDEGPTCEELFGTPKFEIPKDRAGVDKILNSAFSRPATTATASIPIEQLPLSGNKNQRLTYLITVAVCLAIGGLATFILNPRNSGLALDDRSIERLLDQQERITLRRAIKNTKPQLAVTKRWTGHFEKDGVTAAVMLYTKDDVLTEWTVAVATEEPPPLTDEEYGNGIERIWLERVESSGKLRKTNTPATNPESKEISFLSPARAFLKNGDENARVSVEVSGKFHIDAAGFMTGDWKVTTRNYQGPTDKSPMVKRGDQGVYEIFLTGKIDFVGMEYDDSLMHANAEDEEEE